jgi:tRNA dimethylallyltransferase
MVESTGSKPVIYVLGTTGVGKSKVAIEIAR